MDVKTASTAFKKMTEILVNNKIGVLPEIYFKN